MTSKIYKGSLIFSLSLIFVMCFQVSAAVNFAHEASPAEIRAAQKSNRLVRLKRSRSLEAATRQTPSWSPVLDTSDWGYVLMSSEENYSDEVENLRKTIAQNLPSDVRLVILTHESDAPEVKSKYQKWIDSERLIVATDRDPYVYNGFWARDSFPLPVFDSVKNEVRLISARYYRNFHSAEAVASSVHGALEKTDFTFVGGNLLADEEGNCFTVESSRLFDMTAEDLKSIYGCREVRMMEHVSGIGDVDEVLKPLGQRKMLLTAPEYKSRLESWGYQVIMLPTLRGTYRTHANSLIVGKKVFMPSFGIAQDEEARRVYEGLGYEVIPIRTKNLSDNLRGSIHCQTMAYPKIDQSVLFRSLKLRAL